MIVTFFLIAPLVVTLLVLTINLVGAGLRDLYNMFEGRQKEPEPPTPAEVPTEAEVDRYIEELKKEREPRQKA